MFHDVPSGLKQMVAAEPVADGRTTHPLPPRWGIYVALNEAFLTAGQVSCVYTTLGA